MKYNKIITAFSMLFLILLGACNDYTDSVESSPEVSDDCVGVYFPESNSSAFELEPTETTEITLTIARTDSTSAVDVPLTVETNDSDVFVIPGTVSFAAGEAETDFTVSFSEADEGITYNLELAVEGDDYVNPYSSLSSTLSTSVTRIKWETIDEPMVYVDGTFNAIWGLSNYAMYVYGEKAELGDVVRYRFKNVYMYGTGEYDEDDDYVVVADEDGIYDGYPYVWPGEFDETTDYYTTIEIDDPDGLSGDVFMYAHEIGVDWNYGMMSIGSVYLNVSEDLASYPLGTLEDDVITFPENSLYMSMADYSSGAEYASSLPTYIYLTKDAYLSSSLGIEDYNDLEYDEIAGEVSEFESDAYSESWTQTFGQVVDLDPDNDDSEYKNLYVLPDLYTTGYGVAFYAEDGEIDVPDDQSVGVLIFGEAIYVSQSDSLESSIEVTSKGVTIYTLGLAFHLEDGTIIGEYTETFYYSEDAIEYTIDDFVGTFTMTGSSQFSGYDDAEMTVTIAEGESDDALIITGVDYAEEIEATFDESTGVMSIAPQALADLVVDDVTYDLTLYTTDADGYSTTSVVDFSFNMSGNLVTTSTSVGDGYLIYSVAIGGWVDGYYDLVFTPDLTTESATISTKSPISTVYSDADLKVKEDVEVKAANNFEISDKKVSSKFSKKLIER
jgi:hypothetical protein